MKLLIDMNLSPAWAEFPRSNGHEADHWSSLGSPSAPDSEIMIFARAHGYVVLTHDLDFSAILAANQGRKPSVIQLRADSLSPEALGAWSLRLSRIQKWKWNWTRTPFSLWTLIVCASASCHC
ncbi:MAG: DUF5615 family PIN-like protein [Acidobacteriaceae bacterium]